MLSILLTSMASVCAASPLTNTGFRVVSESVAFLSRGGDGDYTSFKARGQARTMLGSSAAFDEDTTRQRLYEAYATYCPDARLQSWDCFWCNKTSTKYTYVASPENKVENAKAYVGYAPRTANGPGKVLVAFRGTQALSLKNWIEDINGVVPVDFFSIDGAPVGTKVHPGFLNAYSSIRTQVIAGVLDALQLCAGVATYVCEHGACVPGVGGTDLKTCQAVCVPNATAPTALNVATECEVIVTGHSLGAAEAVHAALDLKSKLGLKPKVTTFGLPRVGNAVFAQFWNTKIQTAAEYTHWRVVNNMDPVPRLPEERAGYKHISREVWEKGPDYTICGGTRECDSGKHFDPLDHLRYMGEQLLDGAIQCEAR